MFYYNLSIFQERKKIINGNNSVKNSHAFNFIMHSLLWNSHRVRKICRIPDNLNFTYWKLNTTMKKTAGLILASFLPVLPVLVEEWLEMLKTRAFSVSWPFRPILLSTQWRMFSMLRMLNRGFYIYDHTHV